MWVCWLGVAAVRMLESVCTPVCVLRAAFVPCSTSWARLVAERERAKERCCAVESELWLH